MGASWIFCHVKAAAVPLVESFGHVKWTSLYSFDNMDMICPGLADTKRLMRWRRWRPYRAAGPERKIDKEFDPTSTYDNGYLDCNYCS